MQVQMILQYDALSLAVKGVYEPNDKFASTIVEYTFAKPVEEGIIKWSSEDATIDDISVYLLDHSYKAANVSFEQDPNDTDMWVKKDVLNGSATSEKSGEIPTLFIIIYSVMGVAILALLTVIIIISVKKRGKVQ